MSDLEFVGKMNPQPFISLEKEERMRVEGIKRMLLQEASRSRIEAIPNLELTYERDGQNDF